MKQIAGIPILLGLFGIAVFKASALTLTNVLEADTFVRSAAPTFNYGGAGNLSVSGSAAVNGTGQQNGLFDSLMGFSMSGTMSNFNAAYGAGNWALSSVTLRLTEQATPNNSLYNRGVGQFEIRWITNDAWIEGTGSPNIPTTDGAAYNDLPSLLNPASDRSLGAFMNAGQNTQQGFGLSLADASFLNDLLYGDSISLYLTASSSSVGFTFNSRTFGTASGRPFLELTAGVIPEPGIASLSLLGLALLAGYRLLGRGKGRTQ